MQVLSSGSAHNLAGLYPRVALLNHSCVPNCRLIFRSDYRLQVRASVKLKKGDTLYISYTPPFYSVISRNNILSRGKQFTCTCPRCCDPTELDTCLSSLRCGVDTCSGHYQHGHSYTSDWSCVNCGHSLSYQQYSNLDAQLLGNGCPKKFPLFVFRYSFRIFVRDRLCVNDLKSYNFLRRLAAYTYT